MSFSGRHFTLEHCTARPKPVQQPPPLIIGGSGKPRTVGVAVRFGAEYNASVFSTEQCGRMTSAAIAATGALRIVMTDETEASTKRWAQFTITCPMPGTIARATIHGQFLAGMAVKDSPEASAIGVRATAAAIQTPAMNSKVGIPDRVCFANSR